METFRDEILKRLSEEESKKLSVIGKRIIDEFDQPHIPFNDDEILIASRIFVSVKWIRELNSIGMDWCIIVDEGLPYIQPICDDDDVEYDDDLEEEN